jgi:hypothetical protein
MAEKVLFEYRAECEESGYRYEFRQGSRHVEIKSSTPLEGFTCMRPSAFWAKHARRAFRHGGAPRRAARKTLDSLERMYQDIYGKETGDPTPEAGPVE